MNNFRIAKFEKVSWKQFLSDNKDLQQSFGESCVRELYDSIQLPMRKTAGSAGYDFSYPMDLVITPHSYMVLGTGIRCRICPNWFLDINPRSGLGFKYGIRLANTRGIIDSDYYYSDNEGHIMVKLVNDSDKEVVIAKNSGYCQGIFTMYGITEDDDCQSVRNGGFGSTDAK